MVSFIDEGMLVLDRELEDSRDDALATFEEDEALEVGFMLFALAGMSLPHIVIWRRGLGLNSVLSYVFREKTVITRENLCYVRLEVAVINTEAEWLNEPLCGYGSVIK